MNAFWWIGIVVCIGYGLLCGNGAGMSDALLSSGGEAVTLILSLAGAYMLWCGLLCILEKSGVIASLSRLLRPVFVLFPGVAPQSDAGRAITTNLAANLLGLGNAATPAGIEAVRRMRELSPDGDAPSRAICMFLVINASSLQLIPTTVISLRAAAGSANPVDILLPTLVSTAISTVAAVAILHIYLRFFDKGGRLDAGSSASRRAFAGGKRAFVRGAARRERL